MAVDITHIHGSRQFAGNLSLPGSKRLTYIKDAANIP